MLTTDTLHTPLYSLKYVKKSNLNIHHGKSLIDGLHGLDILNRQCKRFSELIEIKF